MITFLKWLESNETTNTYSNQSGTYDIDKLIELVKNRKPEKVNLSDIKGVSKSKKDGFSPKKRLPYADVKIPVIIDRDNKIIDGRHRVIKLIDNGSSHIQAIRISSNDLNSVKI